LFIDREENIFSTKAIVFLFVIVECAGDI